MLYQTFMAKAHTRKLAPNLSKLFLLIALSGCELAGASEIDASLVNEAKSQVFSDNASTLYCGCPISYSETASNPDAINLYACGFEANQVGVNEASLLAWDYIVPLVYINDRANTQALAGDLHNIVPVENQIKRFRKDAKHGYVGHPVTLWGNSCPVRFSGNGIDHEDHDILEPQDCTKGDIARVWLYAHDKYNLNIDEVYLNNYRKWNDRDPVSPAEKRRHDRIVKAQGYVNPYVDKASPDPKGSCSWQN